MNGLDTLEGSAGGQKHAAPGSENRLVRLCRCARPSCKYIYPEDEADLYSHPKGDGWKEHRCPKCRYKNYWAINAAMERVKLSEWEPSPWPLPSNTE